ncbi:MAG: hypothetical protein RLZZ481_2471, partial [Pseudomonadota bacterium]
MLTQPASEHLIDSRYALRRLLTA